MLVLVAIILLTEFIKVISYILHAGTSMLSPAVLLLQEKDETSSTVIFCLRESNEPTRNNVIIFQCSAAL